MAYPTTALGQQFHHRRLANDLSDVAPRLSMHTAIDVPLNAGALALRNTANRPHLRAIMAGSPVVAASSPVLWDTVLRDTAGGYNAATGEYTLPSDGVYLVSVQVQARTTALSRSQVQLVGLDSSIYPATFLSGAITQAVNYDRSEIRNFPVIGKAGDKLKITIGGATFTFGAGGNDGYWEVRYLGATPDGSAGQRLAEPYMPGGWVDGEPVNDLKLSRRWSEPMDTLRPYLGSFGASFGLMIATAVGGTVLSGTQVPWQVAFASGDFFIQNPDAALWFDIPQRTPKAHVNVGSGAPAPDGLWVMSAALASTTVNQSARFICPELQVYSDEDFASAGGNGAANSLSLIGRLGGKEVSIVPSADIDLTSSWRCWLALIQLGG